MFKKILIANRGEIAIRIARACHEMGIAATGVYSTVDVSSRHLWHMDEAVCIGEPAPQTSYLNIKTIIEQARRTGAQAIHPGYGFLAENALFVRACEDAGIVFIGPSSKAMILVGDKVASRNTVKRVDVPIIPGMEASSADLAAYRSMADQVVKRNLRPVLQLDRERLRAPLVMLRFTLRNISRTRGILSFKLFGILMVMLCICTSASVLFNVVTKR